MKVLLTHTDIFAEKPQYLEYGNVNRKPTFLYVFEELDYQEKQKSKEYLSEAEMWKYMFSIENSISDMTNMLTLLRPKVQIAANVTKEFLLGELKSFIKNDPRRFTEVMKDSDLEYKSILARAIAKKVIVVEGIIHTLYTGEVLGESRRETLDFIKSDENQVILDKIKAKLKIN